MGRTTGAHMVYRPNRGFPLFALFLLVVGVVWLLSDLGVITIDIPWLPILMITFSLVLLSNPLRRG